MIVVRQTTPADFPAITAMCKRVYPWQSPWEAPSLSAHLERFPEGQLVAVDDETDQVIGMAASLIINWDDYDRTDSYREFIGSGKFENHDPEGRTLYGAEVMVDTEAQGRGVGKALYAARRELCKSLRLPRIRAGGRLPNYHEHAHHMSAREFVIKVIHKELDDPTLGFQLSQGFRVFGVVLDYMNDPESRGHAALIEWINDDVARPEDYARRDPAFNPPPGLWPDYQ